MAAEKRNESDEAPSLWSAAAEHTGYGLTWALSVLLFLLAGWWVDGKLGTEPLFMILGAFLGAAAGFYSLYHRLVVAPSQRQGATDEGDAEE